MIRAPIAAAAAASAAAALLLAAGAQAATVSSPPFNQQIDVSAPAGEVNTITVSREGTLFRVRDTTAALVAVAPCAPAGADVLCPAAGIHRIDVDLGNLADQATLAASITGVRSANLRGDDGNDTLTSNASPEVDIFLSGGNDTGSDTMTGAAGDDRLTGGPGDDVADGGAGDDFFDAAAGADRYLGGPGDDGFGGSLSPDGADSFSGGSGSDGIDLRDRLGNLTISLDDLPGDGEAGENDNIGADVEQVDAGFGDDTLSGSAGRNYLAGGPGNDLLSGGAGGDALYGGDGDDQLLGGDGDDGLSGEDGADASSGEAGDDEIGENADGAPDTIDGGAGTDLVNYSDSFAGPLSIDPDGDADDGAAGEADNVAPSVEDLEGSDFADTLRGSGAANELIGREGGDKLKGGGGPDGLSGGEGGDVLSGGAKPDALDGEAGADRIKARDGGRDDVDCGTGSDRASVDRADRVPFGCERVKR